MAEFNERGERLFQTKLGRMRWLNLFGAMAWNLPSAAGATLLQAYFAQTDPANKVGMFATAAMAAGLAGTLTVIVAGALSDRTRSRWGRRNPWLLGGAAVAIVCLSLIQFVTVFPLVVLLYAIFQAGINMYVTALNALLPDRVAKHLLGQASAFTAFGTLVASGAAGFLAAEFLDIPATGLAVIGWTMMAGALAFWFFLPGKSNKADAVQRRTLGEILAGLRPPSDRDFWFAFSGRMLFFLSLLMVINFQLYILTDFFGLDNAAAGDMIGLGSLILAVVAGVSTMTSGPLSDKVRRRKPFLIGATVLGLIAVGFPLAVREPVAYYVFMALAAIGYGIFISVDQALMVEVLPDAKNAARDLGFLSTANTLPIIFSAGLSGIIISVLGFEWLFIAGIVFQVAAAACIIPIRRVK
ncbi:MAG: MFS transporter [Bifidobacteriaceae bacterium]|jgi:MFS family permease|nr:MFS transporter [Bifidobacteriaceae bacterium]